MPSVSFMVGVPNGPENLERLGVHLLPFQVERHLERLPDFPSEITVPSAWNGRNGNIVPFQFFFYVESLERRADMQAARCTASTMNAGFAAAPPMKPPPMPPAATRKPYRRFSGAGRGEVAATIPRRLWADSGVCGLWACWREQVGGRLDGQRFDARQESRVSR